MEVGMSMSQRFETLLFKKSERERAGGEIPKRVWRFAPPKSASMRITRTPNFERQIPMLAVIKLFPLPPLPPPIVQIIFRWLLWFCSTLKPHSPPLRREGRGMINSRPHQSLYGNDGMSHSPHH